MAARDDAAVLDWHAILHVLDSGGGAGVSAGAQHGASASTAAQDAKDSHTSTPAEQRSPATPWQVNPHASTTHDGLGSAGPSNSNTASASPNLPPGTPNPLGLTDQQIFAHFAQAFVPNNPATLYSQSHWQQNGHAGPSGVPGHGASELNQRTALAQAQAAQAYAAHATAQAHAAAVAGSLPHGSSTPTTPWAVTQAPAPTPNSTAGPSHSSHSGASTPSDARIPPHRNPTSTSSSGFQAGPGSPGAGATPIEDVEDKRVRNTLASARFRAKKKQHVESVERSIRQLEQQQKELTVEVNDLRKENGLLKDMVQLKYGAKQ